MPFFAGRQTAQERLEVAKSILAQDEDGARLLTLAEDIGVPVVLAEKGETSAVHFPNGRCTVRIQPDANTATMVLALIHELRHVEQCKKIFKIFHAQNTTYTSPSPSEKRILCQIEEADAFAFSAAVVCKLIQEKKIKGRLIKRCTEVEEFSPLKQAFLTATSRKTVQDKPLDIYNHVLHNFRDPLIAESYDKQTRGNISRLVAHLFFLERIGNGPDLSLNSKIEDIFDMTASLPVPGGGRITLQEMLDIALKTIRPASYVTFAKMDKDYAPRTGRTPAP